MTASFVTPPFLGAVAWEILAAPNSGLLNKLYRVITGAPQDEYLFNIYSLPGLIFVISCYTFPYVFVLIANALDRIPSDLEDASAMLGAGAWDTARRITIPLALPALLAGALIAFLQAMILFGSPAILALPAGFHTMTTKIWSLFQYPPKPELAAAASLPLLVLTVILLRGQAMILGRKGYTVVGGKGAEPRLIKLGWWLVPAGAFVVVVLMLPVFLPYFALFNAAFSPIATTLVTPCERDHAQHLFHVLRAVLDQDRAEEHLHPRRAVGDARHAAGAGDQLSRPRGRRCAAIACWRSSPPRRSRFPGIVLGVGLFLSYTRPPLVLYGTLWILLIAYITIELPAAYQQLQSAFRSVHPELEEASRMLGATRLRALRDVTAPLLRTSVLATWCFIFVSTIRELSAAMMLFTSETKVVSVLIFDLKESGDLGAISVLGLSMLVLTFIVVIGVNRIPGFGAGTRLRNT